MASGVKGPPSADFKEPPRVRARELALPSIAAIVLTLIFWQPLWAGGGLVGSDIYAYFLPQKAFYAAQLRAGSLPLWNNLVGWGYPQLAESQTGVFYPPNLLLYRLLDLNTAYNASQILHYGLAFFCMWLYARELGLRNAAALLAALVYAYGWFPARICLEWAVVGGAWLPLALWCAERLMRTRLWRYLLALSFVLAVQMLAGHFTLAFVTQTTLALYLPARLWWAREDSNCEASFGRARCGLMIALALVAGFALAAVQLFPTWELKQQSQRGSVNAEHDPAYGYIPWKYLSQVVAPWHWYIDEEAFDRAMIEGGPRTNRVEAHLYFGLVPLGVAAWGLWTLRRERDRRLLAWFVIGILALVYATGACMSFARHLPGFSFFEGPGRWGIVTTLAVALLAGYGLQALQNRCSRLGGGLVLAVVLLGTTADLWLVSRPSVLRDLWLGDFTWDRQRLERTSRELTFAVILKPPVIDRLDSSPVREALLAYERPARLFSPAKNLPTLLGVAALPTYLGLGPAAYFRPELMFPGTLDFSLPPTAEQVVWLRNAGVTHLLSFVPLDPAWPANPVWSGDDPFLNQSLARSPREPLFLYALSQTRRRAAWLEETAGEQPQIVGYRPHRVEIEAKSETGGTLMLTDLDYPSWQASIDGVPADAVRGEGIYRAVSVPSGTHSIVWNYRPTSLYWGGAISTAALAILLAISFSYFRSPRAVQRQEHESRLHH
ncbi:MAG: hypothetical protein ACT4QC_07850 [Planctomycetaceae bacterium]